MNPLKSLRFLWQKVPIKLDFHNVSPGKLLDWIRSAPQPEKAGKPDLLVLIGHTKEHTDDKAFETLLKRIAADPGLEVVTFDAVAKALS